AGEGGRCGVVGGEEAVDDAAAVGRGQVERQAFAAEGGGDGVHQRGEVGGGVDLVDHDHPALALGCVHHASRAALDAGRRVDDDGGGIDRGEGEDGAAGQVGQSRGVEQVDPVPGPLQVHQRGVQRVPHRLFLRVEVGDGV